MPEVPCGSLCVPIALTGQDGLPSVGSMAIETEGAGHGPDVPSASPSGSKPGTRRRRKLIFALVPLLAFTLLAEVVGRCIAYQRLGNHSFAVVGLYDAIADRLMHWRAQSIAQQMQAERAEELARFAANQRPGELENADRYTMIFGRFAELCRAQDATLAVLFVPSPGGPKLPINTHCRAFFRELCEKRRIPLFDATETFAPYRNDVLYLLPDDGHTSRFGNHVLAEGLATFLAPLLSHRSSVHYRAEQRPALLGDLEPSRNYIFGDTTPLPCRVITNAQGLRRTAELVFPAPRTRVLCVGVPTPSGTASTTRSATRSSSRWS